MDSKVVEMKIKAVRYAGAFFLILMCLFNPLSMYPLSAVTYTFSGGRFGDNLLSYCHAKWISYIYSIPLLYRPFPYSDQLVMHEKELLFSDSQLKCFDAVVDISKVAHYKIEREKNILYVIPYFPESVIERAQPRFFYSFALEWKDPLFKAELKKMISPLQPTQLITYPVVDDGVIVGLHVRIGTGFDIPTIDVFLNQPPDGISHLKFPPLSFYIEQLQRLISLLPNKKILVHLFTDHTNPQELSDVFSEALDYPYIQFTYRTENNRQDLNVLEDFFSITQFDYLIRPDANFSLVASKLGDYKILISPLHGKIVENKNVIDEITIEIGQKGI